MIDVFVVEDAENVRKSLKRIISFLEGVELMGEAGDVSSALKQLKSLKPQIMIIDINLPDGSGFDILQEVKKNIPEAICIILSNYSAIQYRKKAKELGADYFFDKTAEFEKVFAILEDLSLKQ
jgi:DNA-binding NarL/FixJ family response regulator